MSQLLFHGVVALIEIGFVVALARRPGARMFAWGLVVVLTLSVAALVTIGPSDFSLVRRAAWGLFVHAPVALWVAAAVLSRQARRVACLSGALGLFLAAVGFDAFVVEPHWLQVTRVELSSSKLTQPLRIAVLADLQTEDVGEYERRALRLALQAEPDMIVFPGDFVEVDDPDESAVQLAALNALLKEFDLAGLSQGAFAVAGNVDPGDWDSAFAGTAVTTITETGRREVGEITLTGLTMSDSLNVGRSIEASPRFHVVVGHAPDFALGEVAADLLIAGHTHGGQVQLPFFGPLITMSKVPRAWASGTTALSNGRTLIVSRGVGMLRQGAPPLRFLCRPEVVIVDIVPVES